MTDKNEFRPVEKPVHRTIQAPATRYKALADKHAAIVKQQAARIKELETERDEAREELRLLNISIASTTAAYKALAGGDA